MAIALHETSFYVTGGTLRRDAPSYVQRQADTQLFDDLVQGRFCYVLTSRQMGKSSLMVRTAARLREERVAVSVLDLTALGQNLTAEQWYDGLLSLTGQQLDLEDELERFWLDHIRLSPLQRWMAAMRRVVLSHYSGRVVIFIDEIDAVRSLPFSTDEFFAGMREFYNHRTEDAELERLTFCLLGVATPSDVIRDTRTTPFNIGKRIELNDFSESEAVPLATGLGREEKLGGSLLKRVLYWTGGHPYLTQRLCRTLAEASGVKDARGVDRICEELFLSTRAREQDDNLLFVRERLLRSEVDLTGLLEMYRQVRNHKLVRDDDTNRLVDVLRLSGITRVVDGRLVVRNRIYERIFDEGWILANVPDAELRRQQAAYRRGQVRAAGVAAVIIALMAGLIFVAVVQRNNAREQRARAEQQELINRRILYAAQMNLAQQTLENADTTRMRQLLEESRPKPTEVDLRGFEWFYLWRVYRGDQSIYSVLKVGGVRGIAISPDGKLLTVASEGQTKLFDMATGHEQATLEGHSAPVRTVAFSTDSKSLVTGSEDKTAKLWDVGTRRTLFTLEGHTEAVVSVAFSPRGGILATAGEDGIAKLWNAKSGKEIATLKGHASALSSVAFSPDGRMLATASADGTTRVWSMASRGTLHTLHGHVGYVNSVAFSPDGKFLATGGEDNTAMLWNSSTGQAVSILRGHTGWVRCVQFSPDGRMLATVSQDRSAKLWNVAERQEMVTLRGHTEAIRVVAFSPDGKSLVTGSGDETVRVWDALKAQQAEQAVSTLVGHRDPVAVVAFSPDGKLLASGGFDKTIKLWDVAAKRELATLTGLNGLVISVAFSGDGDKLLVGTDVGMMTLYNLPGLQEIASWAGHENGINSLAFSVDGGMFVSASLDEKVKLWDARTHAEIAVFQHTAPVAMAAFSPDGKLVAGAGYDGTVKLWDVATHQEIATLQSQDKPLRAIAFSPDGRVLATGGDDGAIRIWDVANKQIRAELKGHSSWVLTVAFSPDGKTFISGSGDQTIKLWGTLTWQELLTLRGHTGYINSVAFSPDGKVLATASQDKTVKLWQAATDEDVLATAK